MLTLVTMVAPSPDWFVGVHNLSLLDEHGEWLASGSVTLYPYDAGSDNGATYGAPNDDANPKQPIAANISGESPFSTAPMGTLTFLRLDAPTPEPATPTVTATPLPTPVGASTATPTPTATPLCPVATPQPFQVDYVSPRAVDPNAGRAHWRWGCRDRHHRQPRLYGHR
ncbi:MAG: spondin domain-containing protein [Caldilineaceae bacterium]|nr:spondin domain-containing protein [Caldilineaceae bacterium]